MSLSVPRESAFRKLPKEIRLQIWELAIVDPVLPHRRHRPLTKKEKESKANNVAPNIVSALRGHHDRELYFEVLDHYHRFFTLSLNVGNWWGAEISEQSMEKFHYFELNLDMHFYDVCVFADGYNVAGFGASWSPKQVLYSGDKHITLNVAFSIASDLSIATLVIAMLPDPRRIIIQRPRSGNDEVEIEYYNTVFEMKARLTTVRTNPLGETWILEKEDGNAIKPDIFTLLDIRSEMLSEYGEDLTEWLLSGMDELHHVCAPPSSPTLL